MIKRGELRSIRLTENGATLIDIRDLDALIEQRKRDS
jgi:hypothetical protein